MTSHAWCLMIGPSRPSQGLFVLAHQNDSSQALAFIFFPATAAAGASASWREKASRFQGGGHCWYCWSKMLFGRWLDTLWPIAVGFRVSRSLLLWDCMCSAMPPDGSNKIWTWAIQHHSAKFSIPSFFSPACHLTGLDTLRAGIRGLSGFSMLQLVAC